MSIVGIEVGAIAGVGGTGLKVEVGITVSVGTTLAVDKHEAKIKATSKTVRMFLIFIDTFAMRGTATN